MYSSICYEVPNCNAFNHFHNSHVLKFWEFIKNVIIAGKPKDLGTSIHYLLDSRDIKVMMSKGMEDTECVSLTYKLPNLT
jgi:hypothetical protein